MENQPAPGNIGKCRQKSVDFAGYRVTPDSVEPLPKSIESIKNFPTPRNITDVRRWFGLVIQAANYNQLRDLVEPFRKFLSPKVKFDWSQKLDEVFENAKLAIIEAIKEGVKIFDTKKQMRRDNSSFSSGSWETVAWRTSRISGYSDSCSGHCLGFSPPSISQGRPTGSWTACPGTRPSQLLA